MSMYDRKASRDLMQTVEGTLKGPLRSWAITDACAAYRQAMEPADAR